MTAPSVAAPFIGWGNGNTMYGYKVTGTGGPSYLILAFVAPSDGVLSAADVSSVATSLNTYLSGLTGVTGSTKTQVTLSGSTGSGYSQFGGDEWGYAPVGTVPQIQLDSSWAIEGFIANKAGGVSSLAWLYSSSPSDGMFNATVMGNITDNVKSSLAGLTGVTSAIKSPGPTITGLPS